MHENQSVIYGCSGMGVFITVRVLPWAAASSIVLIEFKRHSYEGFWTQGPPWLNWSQWLLLSHPLRAAGFELLGSDWCVHLKSVDLKSAPWKSMKNEPTGLHELDKRIHGINSDGDFIQRHGAYGCGLMDPTMCLASKQELEPLALETGSGVSHIWCDWPRMTVETAMSAPTNFSSLW